MQQHNYLLVLILSARIGFDTAESEPSKVWYEGRSPCNYNAWIPHFRPRLGPLMASHGISSEQMFSEPDSPRRCGSRSCTRTQPRLRRRKRRLKRDRRRRGPTVGLRRWSTRSSGLCITGLGFSLFAFRNVRKTRALGVLHVLDNLFDEMLTTIMNTWIQFTEFIKCYKILSNFWQIIGNTLSFDTYW